MFYIFFFFDFRESGVDGQVLLPWLKFFKLVDRYSTVNFVKAQFIVLLQRDQ